MSTLAAIGFDWPDLLDAVCHEWYHYGSRVTNPDDVRPDSDYDYCGVVDEAEAHVLMGALTAIGFERDGKSKYPIWFLNGQFVGIRRGEINIVLTHSQDWYDRHKAATLFCSYIRLSKEDRIAVFRMFGV